MFFQYIMLGSIAAVNVKKRSKGDWSRIYRRTHLDMRMAAMICHRLMSPVFKYICSRGFTGINLQLGLNSYHIIFWILQKKGGTCSPKTLDRPFTEGYLEKTRNFPAGGLPLGIFSTFVSTWHDWIFPDPLLKLIYPTVTELNCSSLLLWDGNNSLSLCQQTKFLLCNQENSLDN